MNRVTVLAAVSMLAITPSVSAAQQPPAPQPFSVGNRLGLPITPAADGTFEAISPNVKVYGAIYSAESCSYDAERGVIVVPNRGVPQNVQTNNAWVSFINHDGSVHTARWIGVQNPAERARADAAAGAERAVRQRHRQRDAVRGRPRRRHDAERAERRRHSPLQHADGRAGGEIRVDQSPWFNDIEVADDGTIYATQTGDRGADAGFVDVAGVEDLAGRHRVDLRAGRAAPPAERRRARPAGQHRRRQHR